MIALNRELAVTDNLDGTVNLAGAWGASAAGAAVDVFRAAWNPAAGSQANWSFVQQATANGSGSWSLSGVPTDYGYWLWQAGQVGTVSVAADAWTAVSAVAFRPVVDPADPVHKRVIDAMVTMIRSLNLTGIGSAANKVFARWAPNFVPGTDDLPAAGGLPQIQVGPYPREVPLGWLTNRDDVGYPVAVGFFDSVSKTLDSNMARNLKWRRQVAARFRSQQLAGVPEVVLCDWQPDMIAYTGYLAQQYWIGGMVFTYRSRETRGLVA